MPPRLIRVVPLLMVALAAMSSGCVGTRPGPDDWRAFQARRVESLAGTNGWTTLVARHWLAEGRTFAGSDPTNQLVLPAGRAAGGVGVFIRRGKHVRFEAAPGVDARVEGQPVRGVDFVTDAQNNPTRLHLGPLNLVIIERGDRLAVRVRDPEAPSRLHFKGLKYFPYDPAWRLRGRYEAFSAPRTLRVSDVTGGMQELVSPGLIAFSHGGAEHHLEVVEESGEADFFVIFRDQTAGRTTYGPDRFLYVARPGADGVVTIDFNRAYTPPCGFTRFAVCPLPPRQNVLPFGIRAGERAPEGHP